MTRASHTALHADPGAGDPGNAMTFGNTPDEPGITGRGRSADDGPDFAALQHSDEFRTIRRRLRWFIFPVTVVFCGWYLGYVLLAAYAHDFMSRPVTDHINVGLVLGLLQFVTTMIITGGYVFYMRRHVDPRIDDLRARTEENPK